MGRGCVRESFGICGCAGHDRRGGSRGGCFAGLRAAVRACKLVGGGGRSMMLQAGSRSSMTSLIRAPCQTPPTRTSRRHRADPLTSSSLLAERGRRCSGPRACTGLLPLRMHMLMRIRRRHQVHASTRLPGPWRPDNASRRHSAALRARPGVRRALVMQATCEHLQLSSARHGRSCPRATEQRSTHTTAGPSFRVWWEGVSTNISLLEK